MERFNLLYKGLRNITALMLVISSWTSLMNKQVLDENKISNPVNNILITQNFSENHLGVDLIDKFNDRRVFSISRCRVIKKGFTGNRSPFITCYSSIHKKYYKYIHITSNLEINQILDSGDYIGDYNNEGNSKGFHLHVEVYDLKNNFDKDSVKKWK